VTAELGLHRDIANVDAAEHEGVHQFAGAAVVQALGRRAVLVVDIAGDEGQRGFGLERLVSP
jgi:hypothetical protein